MKRSFIKQFLVLSIILALTIMNAGIAHASSDRYKKLEGQEKFSEIKEELINSTYQISHYKAGDAYQELSNALNKFRKLHITFEKAKNVDSVIEEVADGLTEIAVTYEKIGVIIQG